MGNARSESSLGILTGDMRGRTSGSIYGRERTGQKMDRKKQEKSQARRDSDGTLRGSLHGSEGSAEGASDTTGDTTTTQDIHQPIWSAVSGHSEMIPPPPTDVYTSTETPKEDPHVVVSYLELPMLENIFQGYFSNRVDIRLDSEQTRTLRALLFGLQSRYARLKNGKEVANGQDAIKWVLEQLTP